MDAVILCGGLGTRLRSVIQDVPKPMAPIREKPFLEYLIKSIVKSNEFKNIILCVGYKFETIKDYFGDSYDGIPIQYSVEETPLGTGGAIKKAISLITDERFVLLNGDTFFSIDFSTLINKTLVTKADIVIALKKMYSFDRYGTVVMVGDCITDFKEKMFLQEGVINGGVYVVCKSVFNRFDLPEKFSFEKNILENQLKSLNVKGIISDGYFIDIGIPEDYEKAIRELTF